jgi:hypothetical protein
VQGCQKRVCVVGSEHMLHFEKAYRQVPSRQPPLWKQATNNGTDGAKTSGVGAGPQIAGAGKG